MDASSGEEEDWPVTRPGKRRRLSEPSDGVHEIDEVEVESDEYDLPSIEVYGSEYGCHDTDRPRGPKKSKYLINLNEVDEPKEPTFVTQLTQPNSSPSRIRGPRWKKRPTPIPPGPIRPKAPPIPPTTQPQVNPDEPDEFDEDETVLAEVFLASSQPEPLVNGDILLSSSQEQAIAPSPSRRQYTSFRQTTLFGTDSTASSKVPAAQSNVRRGPLSNKNEPPTHHKLDKEAMMTWVYPTNLGKIREYQFNIVQRGLYHNLLVALPTGLGKTFIAATIMLNWFRWTTEAQIVFVAPTKPLVSQQVEACFGIAGIPRSRTSMLTGNVQPAVRTEEWQEKRVFFMTPQTLIRDLKSGICDPKKIVLLVVDEAHRATGNYAYVEVVRFLRRFTQSFRVLALTATPGSDCEAVQKVIDGLDIARTEIRTEESLDIREYVHIRNIALEVFDNTDELNMAMELFANALRPVVNKLASHNVYWSRDPLKITPYGLTEARNQWMRSEAGRKASHPIKGMINTIVNVLASLAHALDLLKFHGIGPFFHKMRSFETETMDGSRNNKYAKLIAMDEHFKKLMNQLKGWINDPDFLGHPKLAYLEKVILNHFMDAGEGRGAAGGHPPSQTRIMVFAHFRDSAEEIARVLKRHEPMIRPHVFVGQSSAKGSEGMNQKTQLDVIEKFKKGTYNTIVATSIGEEGLDIGEVDLIICYDSSSSPIRMLQRMGRTGRKRAGNIVLLLMRGKEEDSYYKAKIKYEGIQKEITDGSKFTYHDDRSPRILPKEVVPVVDKRLVEIPIENTQAGPLEPNRRPRRGTKKPSKKFHMPNGVETGFTFLGGNKQAKPSTGSSPRIAIPLSRADVEVAPLPTLEEALLSRDEEEELDQRYCSIGGDAPSYVQQPRLDAFTPLQRRMRRVGTVAHSRLTTRLVQTMHRIQDPELYKRVINKNPVEQGDDEQQTDSDGCEWGENVLVNGATPPSSGTVSGFEFEQDESRLAHRNGGSTRSESDSEDALSPLRPLLPRNENAEPPFYVSQKSAVEDDESEDDLPEVDNLFFTKRASVVDAGENGTGCRRARKRRVLSDDDDDDDTRTPPPVGSIGRGGGSVHLQSPQLSACFVLHEASGGEKIPTCFMEDDEKSDAVPGDFDRHPHGWSTSYPHANLRSPLVDFCTNEWKNSPQHGRADSPDWEEEEDGFEMCWRRTTAILQSRKIRRWFLCCSIFVFVSIYIFNTRLAPYLKENRRLVESLLLREQLASGKLSGGVFGHSVGADFPNVIQLRTLDAQYLPSAQAPMLPDPAMTRRLIFVGDIHGCKDDLVALLERVRFNEKMDHLVTTGDMISKGPDSLGTVDLLRSMGASCVRGTHEDYILLLAQSLNSTLLVQNGNHDVPLDFIADRPDDNLAAGLDSHQLAYLQSCPVILNIGSMKAFGGDIVVVHAGLVPGVPLERQDPSAVMNMRTIDLHSHVPSKDGKEGPGMDGNRKRPKSSFRTPTLKWPFNVHWIKLWNKYQSMLPAQRTLFPSKEKEAQRKKERHMTVIYGHDSERGLQIKQFTKGIDTGCVNGGKLTALVIADGGVQYIKQVQCKSRHIEKADD